MPVRITNAKLITARRVKADPRIMRIAYRKYVGRANELMGNNRFRKGHIMPPDTRRWSSEDLKSASSVDLVPHTVLWLQQAAEGQTLHWRQQQLLDRIGQVLSTRVNLFATQQII